MDARKSVIFAFQFVKTNFTDHDTPDTTHGFRDSVLVCKMHDCYCTQKFRAFPCLKLKKGKLKTKKLLKITILDEVELSLQSAYRTKGMQV